MSQPQTNNDLFGRYNPYVLAALGGVLAISGTVVGHRLEQRNTQDRLRYETGQKRQETSTLFVEACSARLAEFQFAAQQCVSTYTKETRIPQPKADAYLKAYESLAKNAAIVTAEGRLFLGDQFQTQYSALLAIADDIHHRVTTLPDSKDATAPEKVVIAIKAFQGRHNDLLTQSLNIIQRRAESPK